MKAACSKGHPFPESCRPGRSDCAVCHRERELARARAAGVPARVVPTACPRGHPYPESLRPGRHDCAVCHREAQVARYHRDPETHKQKASDYAKQNRPARNAYHKRWRGMNVEHVRQYYRERARRTRPIRDERTGQAIMRRDPCSYCGGPGGEVDHITPVTKGGPNEWDNWAGACRSCNARKRERSLLTFLRVTA